MTESIVIAVDGPSGVGKGELTKHLAKKFGYELLDSGAIYRVLAYAARLAGLALFDEDSLVQQAMLMDLKFEPKDDGVHVLLNNVDISEHIRTEQAGLNASKVASLPAVREALLQRQRDFLTPKGLVADGRDMGTVVFPNAQVKIFLDASCEVRANRRYNQLKLAGKEANYDQILQEIEKRDHADRTRAVSPLVPADDAFILDTSDMDVPTMVKAALEYINSKLDI